MHDGIQLISLTADTILSGMYCTDGIVFVNVDATAGNVNVTLDSPSAARDTVFYVKKTDASANTVTVTGTIDGAASKVLNYQYESVVFVSDKTSYHRAVKNSSGYCISHTASGTNVAIGDGTEAFTVPRAWSGKSVRNVLASVHAKGVTGTTDVQVRRRRAGVDADVLSTKITIGDEFWAQDGVIDSSNKDLQTGDQLYIDVDAIHSGTAPQGLSVTVEVA